MMKFIFSQLLPLDIVLFVKYGVFNGLFIKVKVLIYFLLGSKIEGRAYFQIKSRT